MTEYERIRTEAVRVAKNILDLPSDEYTLAQRADMIADRILFLLEEGIGKVVNPYPKAKLASAEYYEGEGFYRACQAILKILEEK